MACENESKKGFLIYASVLEAMKHLSDSEYRECVEKMANYAMNNVKEHSSSPMVDVILTMAFPNLEASRKHHDWAIENGKKGAPYGKKGGRPRNGETKEEYDRRKSIEWSEQEEPKTPKKPLNINIDNNIDINKDIDIAKNIDKDIDNNNEDLYSEKNVISSFDLNSKSNSISKDKFEDEMNESEMKSENAEKKTEKQAIAICQSKGELDKVEARCDDEGQGGGSASSSMLSSKEVKHDIMEARRLANSLDGYFLYGYDFDNFTEQANTLLDEDSNSVYLMLRSIDEEEEWSDSALENLSEKLCSFEYQNDDEYIMTLKDLWSYYLKRTKREKEEKEEKEEMGFECVN